MDTSITIITNDHGHGNNAINNNDTTSTITTNGLIIGHIRSTSSHPTLTGTVADADDTDGDHNHSGGHQSDHHLAVPLSNVSHINGDSHSHSHGNGHNGNGNGIDASIIRIAFDDAAHMAPTPSPTTPSPSPSPSPSAPLYEGKHSPSSVPLRPRQSNFKNMDGTSSTNGKGMGRPSLHGRQQSVSNHMHAGIGGVSGPPTPFTTASWWSWLTFSWMLPLLRIGAREPLQMQHIYELADDDRTSNVLEMFQPLWQQEISRANEENRRPRLWRPLARLVWKPLVVSGMLYAVSCASQIALPLLLTHFLTWLSAKDILIRYPNISPDAGLFPSDMNEGYWWALALFGSSLIGTLTRSHSNFISNQSLLRTRTTLTALLFQKALRVPSQSRNEGDVMSLMSTDTIRPFELTYCIHMIWTSPIMIGVGVWLLWRQVGPASLAGLATLILALPAAGWAVAKYAGAQILASRDTDRRVNHINEFTQGIRVIKYYAWEKPFTQVVDDCREAELKHLATYLLYRSFSYIIMGAMPLVSAVVTFIVVVATGGDMTPPKVFSTLSVFIIIRFPFTLLPLSISGWIQSLIAITRIETFLLAPEVDATRQILPRHGVEIKDADFRWTNDLMKEKHPRLSSISLTAESDDLISIIGPVGSGKSTLLHGLLGELIRPRGSVAIGGKIAYVPQTAFIINASIRDNILFGKRFDSVRYAQVIHACALQADIDQFDQGDLTEIGERGINISGGQKQRVSLARAAYDDSVDIIILDDPLSAVDAHVARHLFDQCINGLLKHKCRIFVTHALQFLSQSTKICVLQPTLNADSYTIGLQGSYDELMATSDFAALIEAFNKGKVAKKSDSNDDIHFEHASNDESKTAASSPSSPSSSLMVRPKKKKKDSITNIPDNGQLVEEEQRLTGSVSVSDILNHFIGTSGHSGVMGVIILLLISQAITLTADFMLARWTNKVAENLVNQQPLPPSAPNLALYGGLVIGINIIMLCRSFVVTHVTINGNRHLHRQLFTGVMGKAMSWFERTPTGRILNRFTKEMFVVDQEVGPKGDSATGAWVQVFGAVIVIAIVVPPTLVIIAILAYGNYYVYTYYCKSYREIHRLDSLTSSPIFSHFGEALSGCVAIRAAACVPQYIGENMRFIDTNQRIFVAGQSSGFWVRWSLEMMGSILIVAVSFAAVLSHDMNINSNSSLIGLMLMHTISLPSMLYWAITLSSDVEIAFTSVQRIREYMGSNDHEAWIPHDNTETTKIQQGWPSGGKVEFRNYTMRYRPNLPIVLDHVNVTFPAGSRIAIVGRTGSGKSTMLLSLFRMVEATEGTILIDDVDCSKLGLTDLRSRLAIIPQDPVLFGGSIRYNLDPFAQYDDNAVWQALEYVQLKDIIWRMPHQLSTITAESGKDLSLGQRQLMCLARAMLRRPRLICLDEATANVDVPTDGVIQSVIRHNFRSSTVITIAHRLNTIMDYDYILVMDQGHVAEFDTPSALMSRDSQFASMVAAFA